MIAPSAVSQPDTGSNARRSCCRRSTGFRFLLLLQALTCLAPGPARAEWVLERHRVTAKTWPVIAFLLSPHADTPVPDSGSPWIARVKVRESGTEGAMAPESVTRFPDASMALDIVLLVDANRGMQPYFPDMTRALATFAGTLASRVPRARLRVVRFGAEVEAYPRGTAAEWVRRFPALPLEERPGVRFDDALCLAADLVAQEAASIRRLVLLVGEGPPARLPVPGGDLESSPPARGAATDGGTGSDGSERQGRPPLLESPGGIDQPCMRALHGADVPVFVAAFSATGWVGHDVARHEALLRRLAGPLGMYRRVRVPQDSQSAPDFDGAFQEWARAITGALEVSYRIRTDPPATVKLVLEMDGVTLPAVVDVEVQGTATEAPGRASVASGVLAAMLVFSFAATVLQWLRVQNLARRIKRHGKTQDGRCVRT